MLYRLQSGWTTSTAAAAAAVVCYHRHRRLLALLLPLLIGTPQVWASSGTKAMPKHGLQGASR